MTEVSVVLPVFNAEQTIERAVRSIFDQTLHKIELIVVDDGSTDDTVAVVRDIDDSRLRLIGCEHRGVVAAAEMREDQEKASSGQPGAPLVPVRLVCDAQPVSAMEWNVG